MKYEGKKATFIILSIFFGCGLPAAILSIVNGVIPVGIFLLCLETLFVFLAIHYGRKCKVYCLPKEIKDIETNENFIVPRSIYEYISTNFPELKNHKLFNFNDPLLTQLHQECRKLKPTQLTVYKIAEKVWEVFNSDKRCPDIYLIAENIYNNGKTAGLSTEGFGERSILIKFEPGYTVDTMLMVMVHEMAHTYQKDKGFTENTIFIESVTDCFSIFLGFEKQFIYGRDTRYSRKVGTYLYTRKNHIGYITNDDYQRILWLYRNKNTEFLSKDSVEKKIEILKKSYLMFSTGLEMRKKSCSILSVGLDNAYKKERANEYLAFLDAVQFELLKKTYQDTLNNFNEDDYEQMIEIFVLDKLLYSHFNDDGKK